MGDAQGQTARMRISPLLAALFFTSLPLGAAPKAPLQIAPSNLAPTFSSPRDGYAIWLPAKPTQTTRNQPQDGQTLTSHLAQVKSRGITFIVIAARYLPNDTPTDKDVEGNLNVMESTYVAPQPDGTLVLRGRKSLRLGKVAGREMWLALPATKNQMRVRLFIAPPLSFQLMAVGPDSQMRAQKKLVDKVINSFRIVPAKPAH